MMILSTRYIQYARDLDSWEEHEDLRMEVGWSCRYQKSVGTLHRLSEDPHHSAPRFEIDKKELISTVACGVASAPYECKSHKV